MDIEKFIKKLNAMMFATAEGKAPQVCKIIFMKILVEQFEEVYKKKEGDLKWKMGEAFVEEYMAHFCKSKTLYAQKGDDIDVLREREGF